MLLLLDQIESARASTHSRLCTVEPLQMSPADAVSSHLKRRVTV